MMDVADKTQCSQDQSYLSSATYGSNVYRVGVAFFDVVCCSLINSANCFPISDCLLSLARVEYC